MNRLTCALLGHDYKESLYIYPRGPNDPPGNRAYKECRRCGHIPDEWVARLLKDEDEE